MKMKPVTYEQPCVSSMRDIELMGTFMYCLMSDDCTLVPTRDGTDAFIFNDSANAFEDFMQNFCYCSYARNDQFFQQVDRDGVDYVARLLFWTDIEHAESDTPDYMFSVVADRDGLRCDLRKTVAVGTNAWHYNKICDWKLSSRDVKEIF